MPDQCEVTNKWECVDGLVERWLAERKELVARYCDLATNEPFSSADLAVSRLREFCQVLVDYVSAGHFEIYDQLIEEAREFRDGGVDLARRLFPLIQTSTETALAFNDLFDQTAHQLDDLNALRQGLDTLGKELEERFVMEDQLIKKLHKAHADQIA